MNPLDINMPNDSRKPKNATNNPTNATDLKMNIHSLNDLNIEKSIKENTNKWADCIIPCILSKLLQKLFTKLYPAIAETTCKKTTSPNKRNAKFCSGKYLRYLIINNPHKAERIHIIDLNQIAFPTTNGKTISDETISGVAIAKTTNRDMTLLSRMSMYKIKPY